MKYTIKTVDVLPSTQEVAKEYAQSHDGEGFVIQALEQTNGRGRQGGVWVSERGNLYMSVILRPDCLADETSQLAFVVALAVSKALETFIPTGSKKTLKWPNDVFINGKKISGILIENTLIRGRVGFVTVGIGINVGSAPEIGTSIDTVSGTENEVANVRDKLLECLADYYKKWKAEGFDPIRDEWQSQAHGVGSEVFVSLSEGEVKGTFKHVDENGWMVITDKSGNERHIKSGSVRFV